MKKKPGLLIAAFLLAAGILNSCKKESSENVLLDQQARQFNDDSNSFKSESDQADNDINSSLQDIPAFGRIAGIQTIPVCGLSIDSSQIAQKILYLNFDSSAVCLTPARKRSGQIKVQLTGGNYWRDAGAELTVTYINFRVVRLSTGRTITVNGVKTLTNLNGNNWPGFIAGTDTLRYRSRAFNLQVQFSSGPVATWNAAHTTSWLYAPSGPEVIFTVNGDTTLSSYSHVASWGINRNGNNFITYYLQPAVSNSLCGFTRPESGELVHHLDSSDFTVKLGVDISGNHTGAGCAYGYKVTWRYNGTNAGTIVIGY